ncbi:MAG TPA: hypothetical protein VLJ38_19875, partial [Polyangiaceae bacterium]|nr:hypothetical protein [Polyangiaceae bacterium]
KELPLGTEHRPGARFVQSEDIPEAGAHGCTTNGSARLVTHDPARAETLAARLAAALCFGSALALMYLTARRFETVSERQALGLTALFGFCSLQLPTHVSGLASHGAAVPFVLAALFALTSPRVQGPAVAGLLLVAAYVMRPTAGVLLPLVASWLWFERRRALWGFIAAVLVLGAGVAWMNMSLYGHAVPPYNRVTRLVLAGLPVGLLGNLVSPSRGLLWYCPWCLVSAVGGALALSRRGVPSFFRLLASAFVVHLAVVSCFPQWWAGWCYGPRFLAEMMPELVLLLIPALAVLKLASARLRRNATRAFAATIGYSFLVAILGTTHSGGYWNEHPNNVDRHPEHLWTVIQNTCGMSQIPKSCGRCASLSPPASPVERCARVGDGARVVRCVDLYAASMPKTRRYARRTFSVTSR